MEGNAGRPFSRRCPHSAAIVNSSPLSTSRRRRACCCKYLLPPKLSVSVCLPAFMTPSSFIAIWCVFWYMTRMNPTLPDGLLLFPLSTWLCLLFLLLFLSFTLMLDWKTKKKKEKEKKNFCIRVDEGIVGSVVCTCIKNVQSCFIFSFFPETQKRLLLSQNSFICHFCLCSLVLGDIYKNNIGPSLQVLPCEPVFITWLWQFQWEDEQSNI